MRLARPLRYSVYCASKHKGFTRGTPGNRKFVVTTSVETDQASVNPFRYRMEGIVNTAIFFVSRGTH
jgi:hypothetical protein